MERHGRGWCPPHLRTRPVFLIQTTNYTQLSYLSVRFQITPDELLKPKGSEPPLRPKPSLRMLRRLEKIESLLDHQQTTLLKTIDTFLRGAASSR